VRFTYDSPDPLVIPRVNFSYVDYYLAPDTVTNTIFTDTPVSPVEFLDSDGNKYFQFLQLEEPRYEGFKFNSLYSNHLNNMHLNGFCYLVSDWALKFEYKYNPVPVPLDLPQIMDLDWTLNYFSESQLDEWNSLPTYQDDLGHVIY
jgi:hypothetical protein